ncbi:MAG TPA: FAD binding domain-containing protein [Spirochaetia bacterium]|nr:FAD binding domain-containing protein [Spirochaetia bacterium]
MVTEILRPATVQEALKARTLPGSAYLGGGTWLNALRGAEPLILISLEKLGLDSIESPQNLCILGARVTFQQCLDHGDVPAAVRQAMVLTASRTLRNMITVGGEIALHPFDSALVPLLLAMEVQVSVAEKKKPVPFRAYLSDDGGDLVLSVSIPEPARPGGVRALSRTSHGPRSLVVAASARTLHPRVSGLRLVASDCLGTVTRLAKLEDQLEGARLPPREDVERALGDEFSPQPDIHASSRYKLYMTRTLIADMLHEMARAKVRP